MGRLKPIKPTAGQVNRMYKMPFNAGFMFIHVPASDGSVLVVEFEMDEFTGLLMSMDREQGTREPLSFRLSDGTEYIWTLVEIQPKP